MVYDCLFLSEKSCMVCALIICAVSCLFASLFVFGLFSGKTAATSKRERAALAATSLALAFCSAYIKQSGMKYIETAKASYRYVVSMGWPNTGLYAVNDMFIDADGSVHFVYEADSKGRGGKRIVETCKGSCNYIWDFQRGRPLNEAELHEFKRPWTLADEADSSA